MPFRVVYFSREMFNDALYFLEQAQLLDPRPKNDWLRWRYQRATIIYSIACVESVINGLILRRAKEQGNKKLVKAIRKGGIHLPIKILSTYPKLISKKMDKKRNEWKYFDHIRRIRNKITHYSGGTEIYNDENLNGVTIDNAKKAIEMVRIMVKHLYNLGGNDNPDWVDQKESEIIN